jgi:hypothetical protein
MLPTINHRLRGCFPYRSASHLMQGRRFGRRRAWAATHYFLLLNIVEKASDLAGAYPFVCTLVPFRPRSP